MTLKGRLMLKGRVILCYLHWRWDWCCITDTEGAFDTVLHTMKVSVPLHHWHWPCVTDTEGETDSVNNAEEEFATVLPMLGGDWRCYWCWRGDWHKAVTNNDGDTDFEDFSHVFNSQLQVSCSGFMRVQPIVTPIIDQQWPQPGKTTSSWWHHCAWGRDHSISLCCLLYQVFHLKQENEGP